MKSSRLLIQQNKYIKDWVIIFKLDEIHSLLNYTELRSLSLVCKSIYYKLRPFLLSQVYISLPALLKNLVNKESGNTKLEDPDDLLNRFNTSVNYISKYVESVHIKQPPLFPDPYLYLTIFENLKKLHFYQPRTKINLTSINLILTTLPSILELTLEDIIIESDQNLGTSELLLPSTLSKLCINNCRWPDYYRVFSQNSLYFPNLGPYSIAMTQKFSQLAIFEYSSPSSSLNFNPINSFLENSPKLEILKIEAGHINQQTFTLIDRLAYLKSIEFNSLDGSDIEVDDFYRIPSFLTITGLSYKFIKKSLQTLPNIELLLIHFPNLTSLSISFEKPILPYLKRVIKILVKLESLELVNGCIENRALPLKLINRSIIHLSLVNFKLNQLNFEDFDKWYALKSIKFELASFITKLGLPIGRIVNLNGFKVNENWKAIDYRHCIRFYKE
ncbi:hypothetical protein CONCODRAFT_72255 [Conidiobolus coronatus NRRL 28638]|uniref:F-box domain-containing protein n=1 Tax=Conidiobolus coronatus (strain ATCC 28846 / CBS 209.66 / NRRL 28638) TaxID=796925 RepID=A0A137P0I6_CONC2|nr:hypothetical protein CONCODRAFT_72255 [Conidiobolus coronatus NRRL 28638]|eukprot:KXN68411.1 hypothetical protein CONCODRAFT_72255 [Conidiobolus coronatus NRRL 28638]